MWALTHTAADRPYHDRGWCAFEWKVALLSSFLVFDLGAIKDPEAPLLEKYAGVCYHLGSLADARVRAEAPTSPAQFDGIIEQKSFTNGKSDKPFVKKKFAETTRAILAATKELDFSKMEWSEEDFRNFALEIVPTRSKLEELCLNYCKGINVSFAVDAAVPVRTTQFVVACSLVVVFGPASCADDVLGAVQTHGCVAQAAAPQPLEEAAPAEEETPPASLEAPAGAEDEKKVPPLG